MSSREGGELRRELRKLEAFAVLVGMLVGAGIFRVTGVASAETGPSVVLVYLALIPAVLSSSVAYSVFLSSDAGEGPGGEVHHLEAVFGSGRLVFLVAWAKWIAYVGALAFLAQTLADYTLVFLRTAGLPVEGGGAGEAAPLALTLTLLFAFFLLHAFGVRWFARAQVWMCSLLVLSVIVLVVPGLFAVRMENFEPLFPGGAAGFLRAMPPAFFAFAGFEVLAHASGEMEGSRDHLPRIFLLGILSTSVIFVSMSFVAFGVLPADQLAKEGAPMAAAAAVYLPRGAAALVALGGVLAVATSVNGSMMVPARIGLAMARRGDVPRILGRVHSASGAPRLGLFVSTLAASLLLVSGQLSLALNIAVFALVLVYFLNTIGLLLLPSRNPALFRTVRARCPRSAQVVAGAISLLFLGGMIVVQLLSDAETIAHTTLRERIVGGGLTAAELSLFWGVLGIAFFEGARRSRAQDSA